MSAPTAPAALQPPDTVTAPPAAAQVTILPTTISDVLWQQGWSIGAGVDIQTGAIRASPFEVVDTLRVGPMSQEHRMRKIYDQTAQSLEHVIGMRSTGTLFNVPPLDFSAGVSLGSRTSLFASDSTAKFVAYYKSTSSSAQPNDRAFRVSAKARQLARTDLAAFREIYGDYFVSTATMGAIFVAVVTLSRLKRETRDIIQVSGGLRAGVLDFDHETAVEFDKQISQTHEKIDLSVEFFNEGLDPDASSHVDDPPPQLSSLKSFAAVHEALAWFTRHQQPTQLFAHLRHYSFVLGLETIPKTLPVPPSAFEEIQDIRTYLFECVMLERIIPDVYDDGSLEMLKRRTQRLVFDCRNGQRALVSSALARKELLDQVVDLRSGLKQFHEAYALFRRASAHQSTEPLPRDDENRGIWHYGLSDEDSTKLIPITKGPFREFETPRTGKDRSIELNIPPGQHVVGWQIIAREKLNGSWRRVSSSIILSRKPILTARSRMMSKCRWTLETFVVEDPYFGVLYTGSEKPQQTTLNSNDAPPAS